MSEKKIITISRQFGSGGHSIGLALAEKLDLPFYDKDLIMEVAKKAGFDERFVRAMDAAEVPARGLAAFFVGRDIKGKSFQDYIYDAECSVINDLAEKGPFIVVGRGADFILKDREDTLKVFVYASREYRAKRIVERYGKTEIPVKKLVKEKDKRRAARYKYHTKREWADVQNYDLALNTGLLGQEESVEIILRTLEVLKGE
ncbi:AAA family ATPase [Eubacterium sp. AB3007]|jgi:cytidylate kinase|uniref:cytidylate kinase-like family protein n=1 Tax=Eubacterium sp. AB3007 TaxID=1392487 RepID=UPI00048862CB|nr:cytidylate kinase-like family protein [Eubacterium sp. AB3007]